MDQLPLIRGNDGRLRLRASSPVTLAIDYADVLGTGRQAVVFAGDIVTDRGNHGSSLCGQADLVTKVCGQSANMCSMRDCCCGDPTHD